MKCSLSFTNCSIYSYARLSAAAQNRFLLWVSHPMRNPKGPMSARWKIGERVATPNGFIAEIVSLTDDRALISYLSTPPGSGETDLPLGLLRPATARDLLLAGIKK